MSHRTLIQPAELDALLRTQPARTVVFDCSFELTRPDAGRQAYASGHLPGALYLHLDEDLSGAPDGRNGRHPLPVRDAFAARLGALGVGDDSQVVVYDSAGGTYAARAWWMLRWAGHAAVAVLDGGLAAWTAAGLPVETTPPAPRAARRFTLREPLATTVDRETLLADRADPRWLVIDARSADRFRGENETLDPIGGRIAGSRNRPFRRNLGPDGRFKAAETLRSEFLEVAGDRPVAQWVHSCGSGVTACHNLLALEVAGLGGAALYPGSWSEWCAWPGAPMETGAP